MKYERLAGATGAGLSLLVLAGCASEQDPHTSKANVPTAVARQIGKGALQLRYTNAEGKQISASAVRIIVNKAKAVDITAAHTVAGAKSSCDIELTRKAQSSGVEYTSPSRQSPTKEYAEAVAKSNSQSPNLAGHDIAGLVSDSDEAQKDGIVIPEAVQLGSGDTFTFVNYQNAPSGKPRTVSSGDKYGDPAVFTGKFVGYEGTKIVALTGSGETYGSIDEKVTRDGASGGAAFVNDGKASFAGITVATSDYEVTTDDVAERFGTTMSVPDGSRFTYIEPVSKGDAQQLYDQAMAHPECGAN